MLEFFFFSMQPMVSPPKHEKQEHSGHSVNIYCHAYSTMHPYCDKGRWAIIGWGELATDIRRSEGQVCVTVTFSQTELLLICCRGVCSAVWIYYGCCSSTKFHVHKQRLAEFPPHVWGTNIQRIHGW